MWLASENLVMVGGAVYRHSLHQEHFSIKPKPYNRAWFMNGGLGMPCVSADSAMATASHHPLRTEFPVEGIWGSLLGVQEKAWG